MLESGPLDLAPLADGIQRPADGTPREVVRPLAEWPAAASLVEAAANLPGVEQQAVAPWVVGPWAVGPWVVGPWVVAAAPSLQRVAARPGAAPEQQQREVVRVAVPVQRPVVAPIRAQPPVRAAQWAQAVPVRPAAWVRVGQRPSAGAPPSRRDLESHRVRRKPERGTVRSLRPLGVAP